MIVFLHRCRLKQYSIVIVDEVHERHISTDMLLGLLKIIASKRPDFRIVIMSATMDPQKYIHFFTSPLNVEKGDTLSVNVISVPGRTYPVTSIVIFHSFINSFNHSFTNSLILFKTFHNNLTHI